MIKSIAASIAISISAPVTGYALAPSTAVRPDHSSVIYTRPTATSSQHISLDGKWDVRLSPKGKWHKVNVPGELAMQGLAPEHNEVVTYRKSVKIPSRYNGRKLILRFNGTYSYATLKINGKTVITHRGGFTRWDTDITSFVHPGRNNLIELDLIDPIEEISYASGYAHHPVAGILRSVEIFTQPASFITNLKVDAILENDYTDGKAVISFINDNSSQPGSNVTASIISPDKRIIATTEHTLSSGENKLTLSVTNPMKWDAEHPNLYTLLLSFETPGQDNTIIEKNIGFRNVEVDGNRLLVNGKPVKLRGACRHDIHPTLGRATDRATDSIDARLFKSANMNFVRTSHYPPSEDFLEFCDRYGIYVESETGVCFVDTYRQENYQPGASENDSLHTAQYIGQLSEMAGNFQSHPSIIMWSIGNESVYGTNFTSEYDWIKTFDPSRPVIFSYPGTVPDSVSRVYEILSMHYPPVSGNMSQFNIPIRNFGHNDFPTLHDEWAHPACYTYTTLRDDPGIREFWGQSLDKMWSGVMKSEGALGGAIWGYIDEVFHVPAPKEGDAWWKEFALTQKPEGYRGNCVGYGEWGIVDIYRRTKPEFWATKKAYSPVRVEIPANLNTAAWTDIILPVLNRFDHTDLSELTALLNVAGNDVQLTMPSVAPHERGFLRIPAHDWSAIHAFQLAFLAGNDSIDSYTVNLTRKTQPKLIASTNECPLTIDQTEDFITVTGSNFSIPFSRTTGLISDGVSNGKVVVEKGPYLNAYINYNHLTGAEIISIADHMTIDPTTWNLDNLNVKMLPSGNALAVINGTYGYFPVEFRIIITPGGDIDIDYNAEGLPDGYLRETGLVFELNDNFATLDWERNGYWDSYPGDAMSGNHGQRPLYNDYEQEYGQKPDQPWAADTKNFYYWSDEGTNAKKPLTNWAKAMKENVRMYTLTLPSGESFSAISPDGSIACRLNKPDGKKLTLYINNRWDYPEIAWGNYCKAESPLPLAGHISLSLRAVEPNTK
ncbi:MAG: beta-galactosidase [Bacteroides sp.]|nr:beta-galactosidase [Bacteroides sp.]